MSDDDGTLHASTFPRAMHRLQAAVVCRYNHQEPTAAVLDAWVVKQPGSGARRLLLKKPPVSPVYHASPSTMQTTPMLCSTQTMHTCFALRLTVPSKQAAGQQQQLLSAAVALHSKLVPRDGCCHAAVLHHVCA
jgi:hypothetical protein